MRIVSVRDARSIFDYDPTTGVLTWKPRPVSHFKDESYQRRWNDRCAGKSAGSVRENGYLAINLSGNMYQVHRLVWLWVNGDWPHSDIDHINGIRGDNRIANLRVADRTINARNAKRPTNNSSGVVGVSYDTRNKRWHAYIGVGEGRRKSLGYFRTKAEACAARQAGERLLDYHENHGRAA